MLVVLEVQSGPESGRTISVGPGQTVTIGRAFNADFPFPDDPRMSSVHLALECSFDSCQLIDQNSRNGTFVNGNQVSRTTLNNGDQVVVGDTTFSVAVDAVATSEQSVLYRKDMPKAAKQSPVAGGVAETEDIIVVPVGDKTATAADLCKHFELSEEAAPHLKDDIAPEPFIDALAKNELFVDAIRLCAHWLPKRESAWWALQCSRQAYGDKASPTHAAALDAAEKWIKKPSEQLRRAAMAAAEAAKLDNAAAWTAVSCFWCEGSLGPPDTPAVPPAEHLYAKGTAGAVMLAATIGAPKDVPKRQKEFVATAKKVASGEIHWDKKA